MSDTFVQVPTGEKIDSELITVSAIPVVRHRINVTDPATAGGLARVLNQVPAPTDYGLVVRPNTRGATASIANVADSATSQVLKVSNTQRISLTIVNTSSASLLVAKSASAASSTNFTYRLDQYETVTIDDYTGAVTGIWETDPNDGLAMVTEVTP